MKLSVIGASGAVGVEFLKLIEDDRDITHLDLYANKSAGRIIKFRDRNLKIKSLDEFSDNVDVVFISATTSLSKKIGRELAKKHYVIDDSSAFRLDDDVPLVVPEVNAAELKKEKRLVSIPNCTTTPLVMVLKAIEEFAIKNVFVVTFQSVSGAGGAAIMELNNQILLDTSGVDYRLKFSKLPAPVHKNIIPQVDEIGSDGFTKEEKKIILETKKILKKPELNITAFCTRVPVVRCHSEAVFIEFENEVSSIEVKEKIRKFDGLMLWENENPPYPTPLDCEGRYGVYVGRVHNYSKNGVVLWHVSDNLLKGAAYNTYQIILEMKKRKFFD